MKKILRNWSCLLMALVALYAISGCKSTDVKAAPKSNWELYDEACKDASLPAESSDVYNLVCITEDDDSVIWNETKDKVLMFCWHHFPDSYPEGQIGKNTWGEMWLLSLGEMKAWYKSNGGNVDDWNLRFVQLIGLPETKGHSHFTALWVDSADLLRPAYETDIKKQMRTSFDEDFLSTDEGKDFKAWFDDYEGYCYTANPAYPWTRLGYTYDWADNGTKKGLCEFLLKKNSSFTVAFTKTNQEFVDWLKNQ